MFLYLIVFALVACFFLSGPPYISVSGPCMYLGICSHVLQVVIHNKEQKKAFCAFVKLTGYKYKLIDSGPRKANTCNYILE